MDDRRSQNSVPAPGIFSLMLRDFSALFGWLFDVLLGNRQASAQFRLAMLVISFMGLWAGLSLILHPPIPRSEPWQLTETLFRSLFAPDVLGFMLSVTTPLLVVLRLAAVYLDDIFELHDVGMAMKYILQSAFALRYPVMTIEEGDVAQADRGSPLFRIGGPGYVRVKFENVAIFENSHCKARVIPSSSEDENGSDHPVLPWMVGLVWCLAGLLGSIYVYNLLDGSPTGLLDWLVQSILEGDPRFVVSAILSIMCGGFIFGIFADIASRIPAGFVGGIFGGLIFGFLGGSLGYIFSGQTGTIIGLAAGMLIIVWRGHYLQRFTTVDGFERLRAVIDLREQKKTMQSIRARTRDGIEIIAQDVQIIFCVYRPEPLSAFYDEGDQKQLTFDDGAILRLVYEQGNRPWTENVEASVASAIREEIARNDLFDLLSQSSDESPHGDYVLREEFYRSITQNVNNRRKEKGFQIEWLGLGTWRAILPQIEENLIEMWKNVSVSQHQTSAQELERLRNDAHYEELIRLYLHPSTILDKFKNRAEKGFPLFLPGGVDAQSAAPPADLIKYELISSYREKLYRAWIIYTDQKQAVPPEIVKSLKHINHLLAHKP